MGTDPWEPLSRYRLCDAAVDRIRQMIHSGQLKPGDRLPPERDLAERLGVARSSIREALRILEGMGLIEVRPGAGIFAREPSEEALKEVWANWLRRQREQVLDLLEAREALELRAAMRAVERVTPEEIERLQALVAEMEGYVACGDVSGIVRCDRAFHDTLCRASRNQFIATLNATLYDALDEARTSVFTVLPQVRTALAQEHRAILEAIQKRDFPALQEAIAFHMESFRRDIRKAVEIAQEKGAENG
jgi:GntR family transcriptional repressor for pyruvate dehydrogenase complex